RVRTLSISWQFSGAASLPSTPLGSTKRDNGALPLPCRNRIRRGARRYGLTVSGALPTPRADTARARWQLHAVEGQFSRPTRSAAGHTSGWYAAGPQQKGGRAIDLPAGTQAVARDGRSGGYLVRFRPRRGGC